MRKSDKIVCVRVHSATLMQSHFAQTKVSALQYVCVCTKSNKNAIQRRGAEKEPTKLLFSLNADASL